MVGLAFARTLDLSVPPLARFTPSRSQSIRRPPVETSLRRQPICAVDDVRSEAARESDRFIFVAAREVGEHIAAPHRDRHDAVK